jgi:hypothetical protein
MPTDLEQAHLTSLFRTGGQGEGRTCERAAACDFVRKPREQESDRAPFLPQEMGRTSLSRPIPTPKEMVIAMPSAFDATLKDPQFLAPTPIATLPMVDPSPGEEGGVFAAAQYASPRALVQRVR